MFTFLHPLLSFLSSLRLAFSMSQQAKTVDSCFSSLLAPELSADTDTFLDVYRAGVQRTKDSERIQALTRFEVLEMHGNKLSGDFSQHEFAVVVVFDTTTEEKYNFYIERNSVPQSKPKVRVSLFFFHQTQLTFDLQGLSPLTLANKLRLSSTNAVMSVKQVVAGGLAKPASTSESYLPLFTLDSNEYDASISSGPSSGAPPHLHALPTVQTYPPSMRHSQSQSCLSEKMSRTFQLVDSSSRSLGSDRVAEDLIKGQGGALGGGLSVSQLKPKKTLSLFELGILANVIHEEDPNYFLLSRQCYWFIATMFFVVDLVWGNTLNEEEAGHPSPNDYLPKQFGKWNNMPINQNNNAVIQRVIARFWERRKVEFSSVNFTYFLVYLILTSYLKGIRRRGREVKA
jgi:hypothetical protein